MKLLYLIASLALPSFLFAEGLYQKGDHCVSWKTQKTMFLFRALEPAGKNCSITTTVTTKKDTIVLTGIFPIKNFDSGEEDRDVAVFDLLGGKNQEDLIFISAPIKRDHFLKQETSKISGTLQINNKQFDVIFDVTLSKKETNYIFNGTLQTTFTNLGLEPPSVAGGLIANVKDTLELSFQFQSSKISGF
ncbi:MAG: hypothetical protein AB8C84_00660 [Oligoflexales bacterium]